MTQRDHSLYFGQTAPTFTILGQFELHATEVKFHFDGFESVADFDAGGSPIARMRKSFNLVGTEAVDAILGTLSPVRDKALQIIDVGGRNWSLETLYINTVDKVLLISAISPTGGERRTESFSGDEYDTTIAANLNLVGAVVSFAWTYGKANDAFLNSMTEV